MIVEHGEDREYSTGWLEFGFLPALSVVRMMPHVLRSRDDGFLPPFVVTHAHDGHVFYNVDESWVMCESDYPGKAHHLLPHTIVKAHNLKIFVCCVTSSHHAVMVQ